MKRFLVIGNPIEHSLSPKLHNYWFKKYNLKNYSYEKRKITEKDLKDVIDELRNNSLSGINVTVPFKKKVMSFCDRLDKTAEDLQSVNTISKKDNKIIGWNTDSLGFQDCLKNLTESDKNKSVFVLGAGGVTASVLDGLWGFGSKQIYLSNRSMEKAEELKKHFKEKFNKIETIDWGKKPAEICGIVINTTSVGLQKDDKLDINFNEYGGTNANNLAGNKKIFIDLIYNHKTNFLRDAEKRGNLIIDGKDMFLGQAKYAFNIWTNLLPKLDQETIKLITR